MSGFSYIIIDSLPIEAKYLVEEMNIGNFETNRIATGEESFIGIPDNEIWVGVYNGKTVICNFNLCLFGICYRSILPFEQKLIDLFPNCEIGGYIFNDTAMAGGYYIIRDNEKKVFRNWDSLNIEEGELEPFELKLYEQHGNLSFAQKSVIYTCEAVNTMLGIKPYHSEEFLSVLKFEVFRSNNNNFKENINDLHNLIFKPKVYNDMSKKIPIDQKENEKSNQPNLLVRLLKKIINS